MIYYEPTIVLSQLTHAHLSRIIVETLILDTIPKNLILPLAIACHYHDHGWQEWEKKPLLNKKTNYPLDFQQIDTLSHINIWTHSREIGTIQDPLVGYLVSKHNSYLSTIRLTNTTNQKEQKALASFQETEKPHQKNLLATIDPSPSAAELATLQTYLGIADYISLMICLNKTNTNELIYNKSISIKKVKNIITLSHPLKNTIHYTLHGTKISTNSAFKQEIIIKSTTE